MDCIFYDTIFYPSRIEKFPEIPPAAQARQQTLPVFEEILKRNEFPYICVTGVAQDFGHQPEPLRFIPPRQAFV